jgi:hypothetical protein
VDWSVEQGPLGNLKHLEVSAGARDSEGTYPTSDPEWVWSVEQGPLGNLKYLGANGGGDKTEGTYHTSNSLALPSAF